MCLTTKADVPSFEGKALGWLLSEGFSRAESEGLDSPAFPDTFAPSVFHNLVKSLVMSPPQTNVNGRFAGCDWAFRHIDVEKVGISPFHLSLFRMLVFLERVSPDDEVSCRERTIQIVVRLLSLVGVRPCDLYATLFGGSTAAVSSQVDVGAMENCFIENGIPPGQLVRVSGNSHLTNVLRIGEPAGPRCELFVRATNGAFLELATVVFERFLLKSSNPLTLTESPSVVCGAAIGVERAELVSEQRTDVFEGDELDSLLTSVISDIDPLLADIHASDLKRAVDIVRSCAIILANCKSPLTPARKQRLVKLRKPFLRAVEQLGGIPTETLVNHVITSHCPLMPSAQREELIVSLAKLLFN